jgi:hypothetical protein
MLRDGLISPRSKVITALDTSNRPGSTMSAGASIQHVVHASYSDLGFQRLLGQRLVCLRTSVIPSSDEQGIGTVNSYAVVLDLPLG